jgi:hypothetical protein
MLHRDPVKIAEPVTGQEGELHEQGRRLSAQIQPRFMIPACRAS